MHKRQKYRLISNPGNRVVMVAIVFSCLAVVSAVVKADVKSVAGLEFSRIVLLGDNELEITQGESATLKLRGDKDELTPLPFVLQGDTLRLGLTERGSQVGDLKFKLTVVNLEALLTQGSGETYVKPLVVGDLLVSLEGSGKIRMYDVKAGDLEMRVIGSGALQAANVDARDVRLNLKGSGDIQLGSLQAKEVRTHMAGSGDISLDKRGEADLLEVRLLGSGDVSLKRLAAMDAHVTILGSGDVEIMVEKNLEAEVLGSGDLVYHGTPAVTSSVLGSGEIRQKD